MNISDLKHRLDSYLDLRKKLGFKMPDEPRLLRNFVCYLDGNPSCALNIPQTAVDWACSSGGLASHARRLSVVRGFLTHLRASFSDIAIPARNLVPAPTRSTPHIYSEIEIQALLREARSLGPRGSLRPLTYFTLIGLMASCGLRVGEALRLRVGDVILDPAGYRLCIRETKFRKSRLVPMHHTTAEAMRKYAIEKTRLGYDRECDFFFLSERKTQLLSCSFCGTFVKLARHAGIRGPKGQPGARLHDLRHTFAVRRMATWYKEGIDVQARLPELSVYLGHVRPETSYWYLTATPELLSVAAKRFEQYQQAGGDL
jgi:integrase/recombinase XerD